MAYNPLAQLLRLTKESPSHTFSPVDATVRWLEILAMLSLVPGMFIFMYAFVPSFAALYGALEIRRESYGLALALLVFFNVGLGILGLVVSFTNPEDFWRGLALFALYGGLGGLGLIAVKRQKALSESAH